ncbi:MAG: SOS response-associated peptidase [Cyclobacteriaceae bacterium]
MYDRLTIGTPAEQLEKQFDAQMTEPFQPSYNVAPTHLAPVITNLQSSKIQLFPWGLMSKLSNNKSISPKLFNLPATTALSRPMHRKMLQENRCIILADGCYAWKQLTKKQQVPYYFYKPDRTAFAIAGVWEEYEDFDGVVNKSFNLITTESREPLITIQEDRPLILAPEFIETWLSVHSGEDEVRRIIENSPVIPLNYHPVSPLINNLKIYDQRLIEPTQPSDQHGNYTLF